MKLPDKLALTAGLAGCWVDGALRRIVEGDYVSVVIMLAIVAVCLSRTVKYTTMLNDALNGKEAE